MLRSIIFNCNSTWSWCYALWSSIAIPHDLDAMLYDLHLIHMILMLRSAIFNCNSTWSWCYALWSSMAIPHDLFCYALWSSIAIPHDLDATLCDLQLQFTWSWCYALDLQLQFHMILMLRSMIFNCNSTWSWCYALWSSFNSHDLDFSLCDLQLQFHMILMLRSVIFNCNSHDLDATLYDLQFQFTWSWCYAMWEKMRLPFLRLKSWKGCHSQSRWTSFFWRGFECKNWLLALRTW